MVEPRCGDGGVHPSFCFQIRMQSPFWLISRFGDLPSKDSKKPSEDRVGRRRRHCIDDRLRRPSIPMRESESRMRHRDVACLLFAQIAVIDRGESRLECRVVFTNERFERKVKTSLLAGNTKDGTGVHVTTMARLN